MQHTFSNSSFSLEINQPTSARRAEVEHYISSQFANKLNARVVEFMPTLLLVRDKKRQIVAAAGIRGGDTSRLFLESYLDSPIEQELLTSEQNCTAVIQRKHIVEIGNFASSNFSASRFLFRELYQFCHQKNYKWVVFTSCQRLRRAFAHMNLPLTKLANASESKLSHTKGQWGKYYAGQPAVMAGQLTHGQVLIGSAEEIKHG